VCLCVCNTGEVYRCVVCVIQLRCTGVFVCVHVIQVRCTGVLYRCVVCVIQLRCTGVFVCV